MEHFYDKDNIKLKVVLNEECIVIGADENFYRIVGNNIYLPFSEFVKNEDKKKFDILLENAGKKDRNVDIINIFDGEGNVIPYLIEVKIIEEDGYYHFELRDIYAMEKKILTTENMLKRYRFLLSIEKKVIFFYDKATNKIKIFFLINNKYNELFDENLYIWREEMIRKGYVIGNELERFNAICEKISSCKENIREMLNSKICSKGEHIECNVIVGRIYEHEGESIKLMGYFDNYNPSITSMVKNYTLDLCSDSLTGLFSKKEVESYAKKAIEKSTGKQVALCIIDIDSFKQVSDNFGQIFGDEMLKQIATIIYNAALFRGVSGRIDCDKFLVVIEEFQNEDELRNILRAIKFNIHILYETKVKETKLGCSIGVAVYDKNGNTYDEVYELAERALLIAKQKGKNRYIIYDKEKHQDIVIEKDNVKINEIDIEMKKKLIIKKVSMLYMKKCEIIDIIDSLREYYHVDRIKIYHKDKGIVYSSVRKGLDVGEQKVFTYEDIFDDDNLLIINDVNKYDIKNEVLYMELYKEKIRSLIQQMIGENNNLIISYERCLTQKLWQKEEISFISTIGTLIEPALMNIV